MRFVRLPQKTASASRELSRERRAGRKIGVISLGAEHLFFRKGLTAYVLPYADISRYFRRVQAIPARIGCCAGELRIENLVLCVADAQGAETELAQIQLPGERAAKAVMQELGRLAPHAVAGRPIISADASAAAAQSVTAASAAAAQSVTAASAAAAQSVTAAPETVGGGAT